MAKGLFITFEGTEGCGKSTQAELLERRLRALGHRVRSLREPGGTPIGEEIRHTLKHSKNNAAMTPETELLLMNASRAQLVREIIRPALAAGEIVVCDRFYDSTVAYQGYGRGLDLQFVKSAIDFAIGDTRPNLTLLLSVPIEISEARRLARKETMLLEVPHQGKKPEGHAKLPFSEPLRDRMEEADRAFFERVAKGYEAIAAAEPQRVRLINGAKPVDVICAKIWEMVQPILPRIGRW
ncbi:MAG: dTMP kinase [Verrucomicrobiota bacterium]|jgi:dTMP kinase